MVKELVWHGHHEAEFPVEVLEESYEFRLNTIMTVKSEDETTWQIERRLQLFKKVQNPPVWLLEARAEADKVMAEYNKAWAEYRKARAGYDKASAESDKASAEYNKARAEADKARAEAYKASAEYDKASAEYDKARAEARKAWAEYSKIIQKNLPELMELHKQECGCGWTPENRNIFKYKD